MRLPFVLDDNAIALKLLPANKMRSVLTTVGIDIGGRSHAVARCREGQTRADREPGFFLAEVPRRCHQKADYRGRRPLHPAGHDHTRDREIAQQEKRQPARSQQRHESRASE